MKKEKSEVDKRIEKYDKKVRIRGEIVEDKRWKIYVRMKKINEKFIKKNWERKNWKYAGNPLGEFINEQQKIL